MKRLRLDGIYTREEMIMKEHLRLEENNFEYDSVEIKEKFLEIDKEMGELEIEGQKFEKDKIMLEAKIIEIENSLLSRQDKINILRELKRCIEVLIEEYEKKVSEKIETLKKNAEELVKKLDEVMEELGEIREELREKNMESTTKNTFEASEEASRKNAEFDHIKKEYTTKLNARMQIFEERQRYIRNRNLSGSN